jgi:hypothetical protein
VVPTIVKNQALFYVVSDQFHNINKHFIICIEIVKTVTRNYYTSVTANTTGSDKAFTTEGR